MEKHLVAVAFGALGAAVVLFLVGKGWVPQAITGGIQVVDEKTGVVTHPKIGA